MTSLIIFAQVALANYTGACAANWVFVANPYAAECKTFSENFRDCCAQCNHNILPPWCNPPCPKCEPCPTLQCYCDDTAPLKRQIDVLRGREAGYRRQIRELSRRWR